MSYDLSQLEVEYVSRQEEEYVSLQGEEVNALFPDEESAIHALYEQLFDTLNAVSKSAILDAMKYLVHKNWMGKEMEEMENMTEDDVCVIHRRQADREMLEATQEIKDNLYSILEQNFFCQSM